MSTMRTIFSMLLVLLVSASVHAQAQRIGGKLAAVSIDDLGLLILEGDEVSHKPWSSESSMGRPTYLQHLAARVGIDGTYKLISDAIEERNYSRHQLNSVAVVNRKDALWGTGAIVTATLKSNKRRYPDVAFVVDSKGAARERWELQHNSAAIMLLDASGEILFFKEGALEEDELSQALEIIDAQVQSADRPVVYR